MKKIVNLILSVLLFLSLSLQVQATTEIPTFREKEYEYNHELINGIDYLIQGKMADEDTVLVYVWGTAVEDLEETVVSIKLKDGIGTNNTKDFYGVALYDMAADYVDGHNFYSDNGAYIKFNKMPQESSFVFVLFIPKEKLENDEATLLLNTGDNSINLTKLKEIQTKDENGEKVTINQSDLLNEGKYETIKVKVNLDLYAKKLDEKDSTKEEPELDKIVTTTTNKNSNINNIILIVSVIFVIIILILTVIMMKKI